MQPWSKASKMNDAVTIHEWLAATVDSAAEFAATTLRGTLTRVDANDIPHQVIGCFVALVGEEESIQIGVAASASGCQSLAQALFASEEPLDDADVSDALGEITNIVAGGVKKRIAQKRTHLAIGLPIVMDGHLRLSERQQLVSAGVAIGDVAVRLLILCSRRGAASSSAQIPVDGESPSTL